MKNFFSYSALISIFFLNVGLADGGTIVGLADGGTINVINTENHDYEERIKKLLLNGGSNQLMLPTILEKELFQGRERVSPVTSDYLQYDPTVQKSVKGHYSNDEQDAEDEAFFQREIQERLNPLVQIGKSEDTLSEGVPYAEQDKSDYRVTDELSDSDTPGSSSAKSDSSARCVNDGASEDSNSEASTDYETAEGSDDEHENQLSAQEKAADDDKQKSQLSAQEKAADDDKQKSQLSVQTEGADDEHENQLSVQNIEDYKGNVNEWFNGDNMKDQYDLHIVFWDQDKKNGVRTKVMKRQMTPYLTNIPEETNIPEDFQKQQFDVIMPIDYPPKMGAQCLHTFFYVMFNEDDSIGVFWNTLSKGYKKSPIEQTLTAFYVIAQHLFVTMDPLNDQYDPITYNPISTMYSTLLQQFSESLEDSRNCNLIVSRQQVDMNLAPLAHIVELERLQKLIDPEHDSRSSYAMRDKVREFAVSECIKLLNQLCDTEEIKADLKKKYSSFFTSYPCLLTHLPRSAGSQLVLIYHESHGTPDNLSEELNWFVGLLALLGLPHPKLQHAHEPYTPYAPYYYDDEDEQTTYDETYLKENYCDRCILVWMDKTLYLDIKTNPTHDAILTDCAQKLTETWCADFVTVTTRNPKNTGDFGDGQKKFHLHYIKDQLDALLLLIKYDKMKLKNELQGIEGYPNPPWWSRHRKF